jgi:Lon protease-like protein
MPVDTGDERIVAMTATLPLFPLNTVLFPGGPLPLRIFETRYVDMVRRCMRESSPFGVVLIRSGAEVGPQADFADTGTTARIVDFYPLPDGLLGIHCLGESTFRVVRRWRQSDGLHLGEVEHLPPPSPIALPGEYQHLGELLRKVLPQLGDVYQDVPTRFEDASWVGCRLAEILPIELQQKQVFLEMRDPIARLAEVEPLLQRPETSP